MDLRQFIEDARAEEFPREEELLAKFNAEARQVAAIREELNEAVERREAARTSLQQYRKRQELGAKADRNHKRWTEDEISVLRDLSLSATECAAELGRSWDSVKQKRSRLGVVRG